MRSCRGLWFLSIAFGAFVALYVVAVSGKLFPREPSAASPKTKRTPWTTSRVVGSPDPPPPFKVVRAYPQVKFTHPLLITTCPGSDRFFVGEQEGVLYSFVDKTDTKKELFFDLRKEIKTINLTPGAEEIEAVYGLVFHPDFEKNRQCFVFYTVHKKNQKERNLEQGSRVSRFTVTKAEPPRIDPASEEIVLSYLQGGHNGGDLHFGPDGMLYISTGDGGNPNPPDPHGTGQDISDLLSSILRIDVNHKDAGKNYAVPKDNPFVDTKGARPEVWAYGLRNPWRMGFDRQTGELYVGDVGWELWETIHRIEKGGNCGWSAMEGPQPIHPDKVGPTPIRPALIELPHTIACSVTGGRVYRGQKYPELRGAYIFGDWETRRLWAARFEGDRTKEMPEIARPSVRIVAFGENKSGEIYFLDYDGGTVHTIERNEDGAKNAAFPVKLSDTGLFTSLKEQTPAAGVVPFQIQSRQWQDGASASYWVAFPGESKALLYPDPGKPLPGNVDWHNFRLHFPKDAVLVRTLSLGGKRQETQLLHFDGVDWHGYSYAWRADQQDADLVPAEGSEKEVTVGKRTQVWQFHSRTQCMTCHNPWAEYALAFQPEQLNRPGGDGHNQLQSFTEQGFIERRDENDKPLSPFDANPGGRKLVNPADEKQTVELRARSYLHANCGHCHTFGAGGIVEVRLQGHASTEEMQAIGVRPSRGDFGIKEACIVKAGDPWSSVLYFRMAKFGRDRMPHIGSEQPDEVGLKLIESWIAGMKKEPAAIPDNRDPDKILSDPRTALWAARRVGLGQWQAAEQTALLDAAGKLSPSPVRDLFEGYLPRDENAVRKVGSNPRPRSILTLKGDAANGEKIFWSQAVNCGSCHKVGDKGTSLGPELTTIGKLRPREDILESILEPSKRIEPKFAAYVATMVDGRSVSGLLVKRDDKEIVLRDAQNKEIVLAAKKVEELKPARLSLMPSGQIAGLTLQEAADLLEYLMMRK
jgi:putative heme-binding domain-containing protein